MHSATEKETICIYWIYALPNGHSILLYVDVILLCSPFLVPFSIYNFEFITVAFYKHPISRPAGHCYMKTELCIFSKCTEMHLQASYIKTGWSLLFEDRVLQLQSMP